VAGALASLLGLVPLGAALMLIHSAGRAFAVTSAPAELVLVIEIGFNAAMALVLGYGAVQVHRGIKLLRRDAGPRIR
jgi:hypothetical protein